MNRYSLSLIERKTLIAIIASWPDILFASFDIMRDSVVGAVDALIADALLNPLYRAEYIAFMLSQAAKKAIEINAITTVDYIRFFAAEKMKNAIELNDLGAFGDLHEVLARIALYRNLSLVRASALHVKAQGQADIISKKYGKIEVGHNGKTWQDGILTDYMYGDFNAVIYGCYSKHDINMIYGYCIAGEVMRAVEYVANYSCLWADKYQFLRDIQSIRRGKCITVKNGAVCTQYNEQMYDAFQRAIENRDITTLSDIL